MLIPLHRFSVLGSILAAFFDYRPIKGLKWNFQLSKSRFNFFCAWQIANRKTSIILGSQTLKKAELTALCRLNGNSFCVE